MALGNIFKLLHSNCHHGKHGKHLWNPVRKMHLDKQRYSQNHDTPSCADFSYAMGPREGQLLNVTVGQALENAADKWGDREGLVVTHQDIRKTFSELYQESRQLAAGFLTMGLKPGDRLAMWGPNTHEWYLTMFAAAMSGLILVNVNPVYQPAELQYVLNKASVSAIVANDSFKSHDYHSILSRVMPEMERSAPGNIQSQAVPSLRHAIIISDQEKDASYRFKDIFSAGGSNEFRKLDDIDINCKAPYNIQFTSGTTGNPKGVTLSHHNVVNNAFNQGKRIGYDVKQHRICIPLPIFHVFGQICGVLNSVMHGATSILPSLSFSGEKTVEVLEKEKATSTLGTPTMFVDMLAAAKKLQPDLKHMETGMIGGATCPPELMKRMINELNMPDLVVVYGLTETSPIIFQGLNDDTLEKKTGTIGCPSEHVEVAVFNKDKKVVPVGERGELVTRGYSNMLGYWDDEEKTRQAIDENGWFYTGDEAVMDSSHYAQILGRIKDIIIRGGENVSPAEVESVLFNHPGIKDSQVFGVDDERLGEEISTWVKLNPGHSLATEEIKDWCKGKMSYFKIPKYIFIVDSYPVTQSGKVQKFIMKEKTMEMLKKKEIEVQNLSQHAQYIRSN